MRLLVIGDPHYKVSNKTDTDHFHAFVNGLLSQQSYDAVVILGDLLDTFAVIDTEPYCRAYALLHDIVYKHKHKLILLVGNHDVAGPSEYQSPIHPYVPVKSWRLEVDGVDRSPVVVDRVMVVTVAGMALVCAPYIPPGKFTGALHEGIAASGVTPMTIRACLAHQEVRGVKMYLSDQHSSSSSDVWPTTFNVNGWPPLISGHIHSYQVLGDNVYYPGSPIQHEIREPADKTVSVFEFAPDKAPLQETRIPVGGRKRVLYHISYEDITTITVPADIIAQFVITVDSETQRSLANAHPLVTQWRQQGWRVAVNISAQRLVGVVDGKLTIQFSSNTSFVDRVRQQVRADPDPEYMSQLASGYLGIAI